MSDIAAAKKTRDDVANKRLETLDAGFEEALAVIRNDILELEKAFVLKQIKQQFFDDLSAVGSPEAMAEFAANAQIEREQGKTMMLQKEKDFAAALEARSALNTQLEAMLADVNARIQLLTKRIDDTATRAALNESKRDEWKALQRLNTQKKTVLELTFKLQMPKDMSCAEFVQAQTQGIQEDNDRERILEDQVLDLSAQTKQSELALNALLQESARRTEDAQLLDRVNKHEHLIEMARWYEQMTGFVQSISGIHVLPSDGDKMHVRIRTFTLSLTVDVTNGTVQGATLAPDTVDIADLVDIAVEENDVALLLRETRHRIASHEKLEADVATLQQQGVMCERTSTDRVQLTVRNTLYHVDTSCEYGHASEWLHVRWMKPSDPRLLNVINKEEQCTTLPTLVDRLLQLHA
ncbi:hypothetical protein SDRG_02131 [Saprolegnia diclina VS20]|uniref:Uncharacterized protein n=1 Tax=Saprolegnia diclina (strain VS20) TaxID=1156394 RepID=T0S7K8_SAPDV|nr:hypothetical protein SDRG_02131 [Saprolegnia diclina VS20]EQC41078.1 hypothetical protein SDRG_02131 [Saprolegnia diclina VS20]|eukprot:XP_008605922.1 hypothetical protein SDRG_02131 [Saprolegnia diclina VS20]